MTNVAWFNDLSKEDVGVAGGKGANLGEMIKADLPIPPGFAVTAQAYEKFVKEVGIIDEINELLSELDVDNSDALNETSKKIRDLIKEAEMPEDIKEDIVKAYRELSESTEEDEVSVAARSSATAEDMPDASFAGQQDTYLNVQGEERLLRNVQKCWASLFTSRAIFYREKNDYPHEDVLISVLIQKMVDADKAGVLFTSHPSTGDPDKEVIEANWGLGETVVSGSVTPDTYVVDKETGEILKATIGSKEAMTIRDPKTRKTIEEPTPEEKRKAQVLDEDDAKMLAELGRKVEDHYGHPQDIEWAEENGEMYLVQSRPITVLYGEEEEEKAAVEEGPKEVLIRGLGASPGRGAGKVKIIPSAEDISKVKEGDILVTEMTAPDWVPAMRRAAAIVTDEGGTTCHAAIVSRELGTPCIVGTGEATEVLEEGMEVTVNGSEGAVYKGIQKVEEEEEVAPAKAVTGMMQLPTATDVKVNLSLPEMAEKVAEETQADGVGLLRAEHMLLGIGKHPRKLIEEGGEEKMIEEFSEGIRKVATNFAPNAIWYRTLDLKTAEFKNLEGGEEEPDEPNPMIGWRGVRRFVDPERPEEQEILKIELRAIKKLVDEGISNIGVMIPMGQHPDELRKFKQVVREVGLEPGEDIQVGIMIEIPAAALIIEDFIEEGIDFVSFGTNDLTQFTLAIDRDNERIARLYDERHPAVQKLIQRVIEKCNEAGVETSICGQAGSYPDVVEKLVKYGISSVSANSDAVQEVRKMVYRTERRMMLSSARKLLSEE
ncbi:MAG: phosphoenolpyruvate synthase [Hadesarchaea archaeon]|nr:phosphoenolpyruvate synthase [Hadesarchaea archaeon]